MSNPRQCLGGFLGEQHPAESPQLARLAASWGEAAPGEPCGDPLSAWSRVCFSTQGLCAGLHEAEFWWKVLANSTYISAPLQQMPGVSWYRCATWRPWGTARWEGGRGTLSPLLMQLLTAGSVRGSARRRCIGASSASELQKRDQCLPGLQAAAGVGVPPALCHLSSSAGASTESPAFCVHGLPSCTEGCGCAPTAQLWLSSKTHY